jgi:hypothetical protein
MKLPRIKSAEEQEDGAPLVAEMVSQASRGYAGFSSNLLPPSSKEDEEVGNEAVRQMGIMFSTILADVNRVVRDESVDLDGELFPPPPGIVKALGDLERSFVLMRGIQSYDDLMRQPLVPWDEIRAELERPESREWMKTALAAY